MQQYRITFAGEGSNGAPPVSFEADDLSAALARVADHHAHEPAEIWCEGKFLGRIELFADEDGSFWRVC